MRQAEDPAGIQSNWEPAHNPGQLTDNFIAAVDERDPEKFGRCLIDTAYSEKRFVFAPDPGVLETHAPTFADWSVEKEKAIMRQAFLLVPKDSICQLLFLEKLQEILAPDTAVVIHQYRFELHHTQTGLPRRYEGQITLRLTEDQRGEWVIYRWEDRSSVADEPTWSELKASLGG